jgi:predicted short-subunit dehydrogenase-like oxidoreductase (DUF2520 family)
MTFTGTSLDVARLRGAVMAVTAAPAVLPIAQALVLEMGAEPVVVTEEAREAYHAALAHVANHLVTLVAQGLDLLAAAHVEQPGRILGPLAGAALDNALRLGDGALTGPVSRGDVETVAAHLRVLDASVVLGAAAAYRALASVTAERAEAAGALSADPARRLHDLLSGEGR